ncbi:MAG: sulfotransferase family 2 domain-containing protein [Wenzhouxiangellaceae bacterium]|nr:sulfotransferase family 2 domain-containing protein [Wenzhouxiangellaceae bacterium]
MILSHRHRFIFLKTNKTAGTSVEIALSAICGEDDIITPISPADEALRARLGYRGAQNYQHSRRGGLLSALGARKPWGKPAFYNHMPAQELRQKVAPDVWQSYFKFCIERNPWDRVVSMYYWRGSKSPQPELAQFLRSAEVPKLKRKGWGVYTIDGKVVADHVCRFEQLDIELDAISRRQILPTLPELPKAKSALRPEKQHYRQLLGPGERALVAERFADEIALLGYRF